MSPNCYALGWNIETYHGETVINHGGATNGFRNSMLYLPRLKFGIVIFVNSDTAYLPTEKIPWALVDECLATQIGKRHDGNAAAKEEEAKEGLDVVEELYPNLLMARIPLALPLEAYVGEYTHAGHGSFVIQYKEGKLQVDATDRTWRFMLSFEHVSGEFFEAERFDVDSQYKDKKRAQFRLGADGKTSCLGLELAAHMGNEMIWFQRRLQ